MQIIPAIDIRHGQCIRLRQGDPGEQTRYVFSPVRMAQKFYQAGAKKIHIVDLDGAFTGESENEKTVFRILKEVPVEVELGGGIRSLRRIEKWLQWGVHQVILGTVAVEQPDLVTEAIKQYGDHRIIVGIDSRNGKTAVRGWQSVTEIVATDVALKMVDSGVTQFIFTDIARDGMLAGPNLTALREFAESVPATITASGGVRNTHDIRMLRRKTPLNVKSVIVGKAIYEDQFDLAEAIKNGKSR